MLAGFEVPTHGEIYLADRPIKNMPPHKRDIGMVFQNYALFPHLTIEENVAFPLSVRKINKAEAQQRVRTALRMIKLENFGAPAAGAAVRRPAAARGAGPRTGFQPAARADGRAPGRPGQAPAGANATGDQATARDNGHHRRLRHPRPERGAHHVGPHRRFQRRHRAADRQAERTVRAPREQLRRQLHRREQRAGRHRRKYRTRILPRGPSLRRLGRGPGGQRGRRRRRHLACRCGRSGFRS